MIYVGSPQDAKPNRPFKALINPNLRVSSRNTDRSGNSMPYWPSYDTIPPEARAAYLDWLAGGCADPSYGVGYLFLYFYGLERRYLIDRSTDDNEAILNEVLRLKDLYAENGSVQRYLGQFLDVAAAINYRPSTTPPVFKIQGWDLPLTLKVSLGAMLRDGQPLSADWARSWFLCHPSSSIRTVVTRCAEEFTALFTARFERDYPDRLRIAPPPETLTIDYQAASGEFSCDVAPLVEGKPVPDITYASDALETIRGLAYGAMADLDKFSRYIGRNPEGRGTAEAHALLPSDLWDLFPSPELDALKSWAFGILDCGGKVSLEKVIVHLEGSLPEKMSKKMLTSAADALARIGFGFAPDPRFSLRAPKLNEPIVLFELGAPVEKLEDVSPAFQAALVDLALGSFVAHADGKISHRERQVLEDQISAIPEISELERKRLRANLEWLLAVPPDMSLLRRKIKDIGDDRKLAIRAALVTAAHADGVVSPEEVAHIEKIYKTIGLEPSLAYSDLHAGAVADQPHLVRASQPATPGEAIPALADQAPLQAAAPMLDRSLIAAIRSDTERVSSVLGQIFGGENDETEDQDGASPSLLPGLDAKHAALIADLIGQDHWSEQALQELCAEHGLLLSGALETINEWSFDTYDEAFLDEYDGYDVTPEIAEAVRQKLGQENKACHV